MSELVGPDHVRNAVTLNSVLVNAARAVGPAMAGILIATVGVSVCFLVNAGSYVAVIASLLLLDKTALRPSIPTPRSRGQLREGLRYVASTPALAVPLAMMAVIGALAYEFQVVLPIVARETFGGGAEVYGFLTAAMGAGAVIGGLDRRRQRAHRDARRDQGELRLRRSRSCSPRRRRPCRSSSPR